MGCSTQSVCVTVTTKMSGGFHRKRLAQRHLNWKSLACSKCSICKQKMMRPWVETARSAAGTGTDQTEGDRSCSLMSVSAGGHLERYSVI